MGDGRLKRSRAYAGGMASAASPKRKWPMRKITGETWVTIAGIEGRTFRRDLLECGHTVRPAHDMIGETYPASRRCGKCYAEAAAKTGKEQP
jgi:hypothetical protein